MTATDTPRSNWDRPSLLRVLRHDRLMFGRMHEDWAIEASIFEPTARVFCIASAGCTAIALARRGWCVTAVDLSAAQVNYAAARAAGAPTQRGAVERMLARVRRLVVRNDASRQALHEFLTLDRPSEQAAMWRDTLLTPRRRQAMRLAVNAFTLRLVYGRALVRELPERFADVLLARLERGFARHANRDNPYAWRLLADEQCPAATAMDIAPGSTTHATFHRADAAAYLESCAPGSFDAFSLSNICDGASSAYCERLHAAVRRGASPRAWLVLRSFREPTCDPEAHWAATDRTMLWGSIAVDKVHRAHSLCRGEAP